MKLTSISLLTAVLLMFSGLSFAEQVTMEGTINGYTSAVHAKTCPVGLEDAIVAAEHLFVVQKPDGTFYLISNIDRAVLARQFNEKVRVTGNVDKKGKTIVVSKLEVMKKGKWGAAWSQEMEEEARKALVNQF